MSRALRLSLDQLQDLSARRALAPTLDSMRDKPIDKDRPRQKYGNEKVEDGGLKFDSKAEYRRWAYLCMLQKAKEITELRMQREFEIIPAQVTPSGKKVRATVYRADFTYRNKAGDLVIEDVKGAVTPEFRIKRKLMLQVFGVEVQEIRS